MCIGCPWSLYVCGWLEPGVSFWWWKYGLVGEEHLRLDTFFYIYYLDWWWVGHMRYLWVRYIVWCMWVQRCDLVVALKAQSPWANKAIIEFSIFQYMPGVVVCIFGFPLTTWDVKRATRGYLGVHGWVRQRFDISIKATDSWYTLKLLVTCWKWELQVCINAGLYTIFHATHLSTGE